MTRFTSGIFLVAAVGLMAGLNASRLAAASNDATEFPHVITLDLGAFEFAPGDSVTITSVRGDRPHFELGGRYLLEGIYRLESADRAELAWFITTRGPSGATPVAPEEKIEVSRGSGAFRLIKTFAADGWPHVSFYVKGRVHGGVYFGEKGFDAMVLRKKGWSDFGAAKERRPSGITISGLDLPDRARSANAAILAYLGEPVFAPANIDSRHTPEGIANGFGLVAKKAKLDVRKLAVDDTEFPYIVYGVVEGERALSDIKSAVGAVSGYQYTGSVTGGVRGATYFAMNMTPRDYYPRGTAEQIHRRLMVRLQMLASKAQGNE
jgi:hypothetical protein